MPTARKNKVDLDVTAYYHCISKCTRNAYLSGLDPESGIDYHHRIGWILDIVKFFEGIFAIDVCAYAVMPDHFHLLLRVDKKRLKKWEPQMLSDKWNRLFTAHSALDRPLQGETKAQTEKRALATKKKALCDISWYMKTLNERIARMANREDDCKGRFWNGRFLSQALYDEAALLACMSHIDLNAVRNGMAQHVMDYPGVSFNQRYKADWDPSPSKTEKSKSHAKLMESLPRLNLLPCADIPLKNLKSKAEDRLPFTLEEYQKIILMTSKMLFDGRANKSFKNLPGILDILGINPRIWPELVKSFGTSFFWAVGSSDKLMDVKQKKKLKRIRGLGAAKKFYAE